MPRRWTPAALLLATLLLVPVAACGGGTGGVEEASDYLYSCPIQVVNGTGRTITGFEWVLIERAPAGDVVWSALGRNPSESFDAGKELTLVMGPDYADVTDPSLLEWRVSFIDDVDTGYGPWTVALADCGATTITVTPADAN